MNENKINEQENEENEDMIFTLTDEDGNDIDFEVLASYDKDGERYFAMIPTDSDNEDSDIIEYVILKLAKDGDEDILVTVDDDDENDMVADYFDDLFSSEIDYDN